MTEFNYIKPVTEIVCLTLKDKLLIGVGEGSTGDQLANQNMHFDNFEENFEDNPQANTGEGGLWDE